MLPDSSKTLSDKVGAVHNLLLIEDKAQKEAVRVKLTEVMKERNKLGKYSTSDLYVRGKKIEESVDDFLIELH